MLQFKSFLYEIILKIKDVKFEVYIYTYYYLKVKFSQTLHILLFGPVFTVLFKQSAQNILQQCLQRFFRLVTPNDCLHLIHSEKSSSCCIRISVSDARICSNSIYLKIF